MDRLIGPLSDFLESRFLVLYGKGIEDAYFSNNLKELDFETALLFHLKEMGWPRIIYIYPDKPFQFLDEESRQLSNTIILDHPLGFSDRAVTDMQPGPYGQRILLPNSTPRINFEGISIGDTHAIRLLDTIMQDHSGPPTVIVFIQAEGLFANFQDHRTLSGVISNWSRLPISNHNHCIFTFSGNNYNEVAELSRQLPVPEIRTLILNRESTRANKTFARLIGGPFVDECISLLQALSSDDITRINPETIQFIAEKLAAEDVLIKTWSSRLQNLASIDIDSIRENGWFSSFNGDTRPVLERLNNLVGLDEIKERITELAGWISVRKKNPKSSPISLHMIFTGNPGTGKTTVARLIGELFHELGILKRGQLIEVKAVDLIAEHVGGTNIKTNQVIDQAMDGILFIDEAYSLSSSDRGGFGAEAIETILTRMEDDRDRLVVIMAGYQTQMNRLIQSNPGLSRRFAVENRFHFKDYSTNELLQILYGFLEERQLELSRDMAQIISEIVENMAGAHQDNFGNAGEMRNFVDSLERKCLNRIHSEGGNARAILRKNDLSPEYKSYLQKEIPDIDIVLHELDSLVGLDEIKLFIQRQIARLKFDQLRSSGRLAANHNKGASNLIFVGNPGTGKTTVARIFGKIYHALGLLRKGHVVEVSMPDLIAGYVGQTTEKVMQKVNEALDGVLFIDEAYALVRNSSLFTASYGQEAVDTLVKAIEDHKTRLVVILAGYPKEMEVLIKSNPGLKSRFAPPLHFEDFTPDQMRELLDQFLRSDDLSMSDDVKEVFIDTLDMKRRDDPTSFGNARDLIAYYERAKDHLAMRIIELMGNKFNMKANLPPESQQFILSDITGEGYTVVVESPDDTPASKNSRLKSWVIPNR